MKDNKEKFECPTDGQNDILDGLGICDNSSLDNDDNSDIVSKKSLVISNQWNSRKNKILSKIRYIFIQFFSVR